MKIAQMIFAAHKIEFECVLDVLAHEDLRNFQNFADIPKKLVSRIGCLVITKPRRPNKAFEILSLCHCSKEILSPAFMKIKKSDFHLIRV